MPSNQILRQDPSLALLKISSQIFHYIDGGQMSKNFLSMMIDGREAMSDWSPLCRGLFICDIFLHWLI